MRHIDIYIYFISTFTFAVSTPLMYFSCTEGYARLVWCDLILHLDTAIQQVVFLLCVS